MKQTILSLTILLMAASATAQQRVFSVIRMGNGIATQFTIGGKQQLTTVDQVQYRITYDSKSVTDVNAKDESGRYIYGPDVMRLDIGEKMSCFYSRTNELRDSIMQAMIDKGDYNYSRAGRSGALGIVVYQNYPEGKTLTLDGVNNDNYRMEEARETPEWEIVSDSTATILGYSCTLARTTFKGRTWLAYYTEDIPLDNGPWKLCGLPGLILKAEDTTHQFIFEAIGLEQPKGSAPITYNAAYDQYEKVTAKQLNDIRSKQTRGDALPKGSALTTVHMKKTDGTVMNDDEMKAFFAQKIPFCPLEK